MDENKINTKMTDFDICKEYREAKNPSAQLKILAQLNCCSEKDILDILKRNNEPLRKRTYTTKKESAEKAEEKDKEIPNFIYALAMERLHAIDDEITAKKEEITSLEKEYTRIHSWLKDQGIKI